MGHIPPRYLPRLVEKSGPHKDSAAKWARNMDWYGRWMNGETMAKIARSLHIDASQVSKGINRVASQMVDVLQQQVLAELIPQAMKLLSAKLKMELAKAEAGLEFNYALASELLDKMKVTGDAGLGGTNVVETSIHTQTQEGTLEDVYHQTRLSPEVPRPRVLVESVTQIAQRVPGNSDVQQPELQGGGDQRAPSDAEFETGD